MTSCLKSAAIVALIGAIRIDRKSATTERRCESFCMRNTSCREFATKRHKRHKISRCHKTGFTRLSRICVFLWQSFGVAAADDYADTFARLGFVAPGEQCRKRSGTAGLGNNSCRFPQLLL